MTEEPQCPHGPTEEHIHRGVEIPSEMLGLGKGPAYDWLDTTNRIRSLGPTIEYRNVRWPGQGPEATKLYHVSITNIAWITYLVHEAGAEFEHNLIEKTHGNGATKCYQLYDASCAAEKGGRFVYIAKLIVDERCRRKGFGTQLMQHVMEQYTTRDDLVTLCANADHLERVNDADLLAFYGNLGFEPITSSSRIMYRPGGKQLPREPTKAVPFEPLAAGAEIRNATSGH